MNLKYEVTIQKTVSVVAKSKNEAETLALLSYPDFHAHDVRRVL